MTSPLVDSRRTKLAGVVAERLIDNILRSGLPVGAVYASEADLVRAYGVSRAVIREAVRLVEHQNVARMRRGPGGGLVIDEPDLDAVVSAQVLFLARVDVRLDEVFDARLVLEDLVVELAAQRITEDAIEELRQHVADEGSGAATDHRRLHRLLAESSRNPALDLFVECLNRMATFYVLDRGELTEGAMSASIHAHARIAEAVISRSVDVARRRMSSHLRAEANYIADRLPPERRLQHAAALAATLGDKRAEQVAADIFGHVVTESLPAGTFLGSEADLMHEHGASRAVFREAVRILEHHRVALMRRGPQGGLFVAEADTESVASVTAIYLSRVGVTTDQLLELQHWVGVAIIERMGPATAAASARAWLESGEQGTLAQFLAGASENRALALVADVLHRLLPAAEEHPASSSVLEALAEGDVPLALHRVRQTPSLMS